MNSLLVTIASIVAAVSCRGTASPSEAPSTAQTASAAHVEVLPVSKPIPRGAGPIARRGSPAVTQPYGNLPLTFEQNLGQTAAVVQFLSHGSGYSFFFTPTELVIELRRTTGGTRTKQVETVDSLVVKTRFLGANPHAAIRGHHRLPGVSNYLIGNDAKSWRTGIANYAQVEYDSIYPGIDLVYYGNQRQLEYDFTVAPGSDPRAIRFAMSGADAITIDASGNLIMKAAGSELTHHAPIAYQTIGGTKRSVAARYRLGTGNQIGFEVGEYDHGRPLVIDPVFSYSTYIGGSGDDVPYWSDIDAQGNLYIAGATASVDFPVDPPMDILQRNLKGGLDAFVTKLNPTGSAIVYSTYLGGKANDRALGISVAGNGSAYVVGLTRSSDFPTTNKAIQPKFAGGGRDGFVTALDPSGSKLVYSTYLGGSGDDQAWIGPTHSDGTIWVIGLTSSTDFRVTSGAFQTASAGGFDCFVTKIDPLGTQIIFSSYVGGGGDDNCIDGTVDAQGHALLTGSTSSTNFPTTAGAFQRAYGGGATDAVVVKVALDGSSLVYSTYLGGSGDEDVSDGRFDDSGNAYVPGVTSSLDFPTTPGALQSRFAGGPEDGYLTVLNPTGSGLLYSTYFGGSGDDAMGGVRPDACGNVYFVGVTNSTDLPTSKDALQSSYGGGKSDAFVGHLELRGSHLLYSSYFGGSGDDGADGQGVNLDGFGNLYVVGSTTSTDLFVTPNAFQRVEAGGQDGFAFKLSFPPCR